MSEPNPARTTPLPQNSGVAGGQEAPKGRSRRGGGKRAGRPPADTLESNRGGRSRIDRGMTGYGDGVERAMCTGVASLTPRSFPVQHRTGVAVSRLVTVDRTGSAQLLCDNAHTGPHVWPNGDVVGETPITSPVPPDWDGATEK